jgi:hypothetical protein
MRALLRDAQKSDGSQAQFSLQAAAYIRYQ